MNGETKIDILFSNFFFFLFDGMERLGFKRLKVCSRVGPVGLSGFRAPRRCNSSMNRRRVVKYLQLFRDVWDGRNGFHLVWE
jgi:hypothetical protein